MQVTVAKRQHSSPHPAFQVPAWAGLPIPLALLLIVVLWAVDARTSHEAPYLLTGLNLSLISLVSVWTTIVAARAFLCSARPWLLLLGCGAMFWGASGFASIGAAASGATGMVIDTNHLVTVHNTCAWLSATCYLAGAAFCLQWSDLCLRSPRLWLAGATATVLAAVAFVVWGTLSGWMPIFFTVGQGASAVRQFVLTSAIVMFVLAAAMFHEGSRNMRSAFISLHIYALLLLSVGLFGLMLQASVGSALGWLARFTQYLGGAYMLLAVFAAGRAPDAQSVALGSARSKALHTYGIAVALVIAAAVFRLLFMQTLDNSAIFLTFYPAVILAALYAGFGAGLLANVCSIALAHYFWMAPAGGSQPNNAADLLTIAIFFLTNVIIAWIVENMRAALRRRLAAEAEQQRLNRSLRLLGDCNLALASAEDEQGLLSDVCRLVVETGGYPMAWIGYAEQGSGKLVRPIAQSGREDDYLDVIRVSWDGALDIGRGPTGTALRSGATQVNQDCMSNPAIAPWRAAMIERGYQSSIGLPLTIAGNTFGALTIYASASDAFNAAEVSLLEELARNLTFGIETLRASLQRKQAEARVTSLLDEQQAILHSAVVGFVMLKGRIMVWMNSAFARMLGYEAAELTNQATRRFYPDEESYLAFRDLAYAAIDAHQVFRTQVQYLRKDGSLGWFDVSGARLRDGSEESIWAFVDISAQKRTEADLIEAQQLAKQADVAKTRFLATMSHEIRTPMNGILGMAQMLMTPELGAAERIDYARTILNSGQTLLVLLNDILDLSRVEAGRFELESTAFDPEQIVDEARALFGETAGAKGLAFETAWCGPSPQRYLGDPHRLRQMLSNLVGNAIKFTAQGQVRIKVREIERDSRAAVLEFAVADTGIGIAKDKQGLLFKPFSQADSSTTRKFGGSGLGLSIVSALAGLMGGSVGVESSEGRGASFWFRVRADLVTADADSRTEGRLDAGAAVRAALAARLSGLVLVVEDDRTNRKIAEVLLGRIGLAVVLAEDGLQALAMITAGETPDLILMDLQMPLMDGYTATERIRSWEAEHGRPRTTIIALTADVFEEDRRRCLAAGMDDFLAKPVALDRLVATLAKWLPVGRPLP